MPAAYEYDIAVFEFKGTQVSRASVPVRCIRAAEVCFQVAGSGRGWRSDLTTVRAAAETPSSVSLSIWTRL